MLGSLTHADINAVYSLFAFYALYTHPQYNSIREVLVILMMVTVVVMLSDMWALALLTKQPITQPSRILGFVWVGLEIGLKVVLIMYLGIWRKHIAEEDDRKSIGVRNN